MSVSVFSWALEILHCFTESLGMDPSKGFLHTLYMILTRAKFENHKGHNSVTVFLFQLVFFPLIKALQTFLFFLRFISPFFVSADNYAGKDRWNNIRSNSFQLFAVFTVSSSVRTHHLSYEFLMFHTGASAFWCSMSLHHVWEPELLPDLAVSAAPPCMFHLPSLLGPILSVYECGQSPKKQIIPKKKKKKQQLQ